MEIKWKRNRNSWNWSTFRYYEEIGAGFYSLNGLNKKTIFKNMENIHSTRAHTGSWNNKLSPNRHRKNGRIPKIHREAELNLPLRCSNSATYFISGIIPIKAEVEKRTLTSFLRLINKEPPKQHMNSLNQNASINLNYLQCVNYWKIPQPRKHGRSKWRWLLLDIM